MGCAMAFLAEVIVEDIYTALVLDGHCRRREVVVVVVVVVRGRIADVEGKSGMDSAGL